jgi:hypothetical protein
MLKGAKNAFERLPQAAQITVVGALGLALGLGAMAAVGAAQRPEQASVPRLDLPGAQAVAAGATPAETAGQAAPAAPPGEPIRPGSPRAALAALLEAHAAGRFERGWALLDADARAEYPNAEIWAAAQADRIQPVRFTIGTERQGADGTVEVAATVAYQAAVEPFNGLTPGRTEEVWRVRREGGTWRVAADPAMRRPLFPADDRAPAAVQAWVAKLLACDQAGAARLEAGGERYGPTELAGLPCAKRGKWTVGAPVGFDRAQDPAYIAAFGPEVQEWARLVPVRGPRSDFYAVVAPLGDAWRVLGTAVGPTTR